MALGTGSLEVTADLRPASGAPVHLIWTRDLAITEPERLDRCIVRTLRWDRTERPASAGTWTETK